MINNSLSDQSVQDRFQLNLVFASGNQKIKVIFESLDVNELPFSVGADQLLDVSLSQCELEAINGSVELISRNSKSALKILVSQKRAEILHPSMFYHIGDTFDDIFLV